MPVCFVRAVSSCGGVGVSCGYQTTKQHRLEILSDRALLRGSTACSRRDNRLPVVDRACSSNVSFRRTAKNITYTCIDILLIIYKYYVIRLSNVCNEEARQPHNYIHILVRHSQSKCGIGVGMTAEGYI